MRISVKLIPVMVILASVLAMSALVLAPRAEAASAPAWSITISPTPTDFAPGEVVPAGNRAPSYFIGAINIGGAATSGAFTVTATLPAGVEFASVLPVGSYGIEARRAPMVCSTAGHIVTCTGESPAIRPGEGIKLNVPVNVKPSAAGVEAATAEVEGGGAPAVTTRVATTFSATPPPFDFVGGLAGLFDIPTDASGATTTGAGAHPYQLTVGLGFPILNIQNEVIPVASGVRDFSTILPPGVVINPEATTGKCTAAQLEERGGCPLSSQIGIARPLISLGMEASFTDRPLYNLVPAPGVPAEFGFEILPGLDIHLQGALRAGRYELSADADNLLGKVAVLGGQISLWGEPEDASHDAVRGECLFSTSSGGLCPPATRSRTALISMPSACSGQLATKAEADSWANPTTRVRREYLGTDPNGSPVGVEGCQALKFEPSIAVTPEVTSADSSTGLSVDIKVPQNEEYENEAGEPQLATANLKDVNVALPAGMTVNPSAADGLAACDEEEIGYSSASDEFDGADPQCPDASKIGSLEVETPLLGHTLPGAVYLATPHGNPFDSLLALYVVIDDPQSGIVIKLPGHVVPDQATGQLTASFAENPQLPFSELRLHFFGGSRAALASPEVCGNFATSAQMGPWSGTAPVPVSSSFPISSGPGGGACASSPAQMPNSPSVQAGTTNSTAGAYAPFVLHLKREDGSQRISAVDVTLPPGETGKLAGIPYCADAALAAAAGKTGRGEQSSPSCPSASEVGTVTVGAGVGPSPYFVGGKAYLAGPYKGAPLSLAIITPAVAGPFDLGTVVVRAALVVNPVTTQITVESDPLPTILQGIPLDIRSISVEVARPGFTLNPTNCEPSAVLTQAVSVTGATAQASNPFQVGNCKALGFKPKIALSLKGATKRAGHPALKAVVSYPSKGSFANIARAQVGLPHSEFLDQGNIGKVCTQPELKTSTCPKASIYGHAKAWSPLLEKPLEGPVYLGVGYGHKLPDMVADLDGQVRILLNGRVDTTKQKGIRNTFEAVPDAPVSRFVLELKGGNRYGLLENSENICKRAQRASARFVAQNGRSAHLRPTIATSCKKPKKKSDGRKRSSS
jgi:hypothetical protein